MSPKKHLVAAEKTRKAYLQQHTKVSAAETMCTLYNAILTSRLSKHHALHLLRYQQQSTTYKRYFAKAAELCAEMKAEPSDYLTAQFDAFAQIFKDRRAPPIPQPAQLSGSAAQYRYIEHLAKRGSVVEIKPQSNPWFREERKLRAFCARLGCTEQEVLMQNPKEFTAGFLERKGVDECF